eukprot:scaffold253879_cov59-Attheya_sp.AAC.2
MVKGTEENTSDAKSQVASEDVELIVTLNMNDVLCGRGSGPNDHAGNIRFRELVQSRKPQYMRTNNRQLKATIARMVVATVRAMDPPGRFLRKADAELARNRGFGGAIDVYCHVDEETALEKAKQALRQNRESAPPSSNKSPGAAAPPPALEEGFSKMKRRSSGGHYNGDDVVINEQRPGRRRSLDNHYEPQNQVQVSATLDNDHLPMYLGNVVTRGGSTYTSSHSDQSQDLQPYAVPSMPIQDLMGQANTTNSYMSPYQSQGSIPNISMSNISIGNEVYGVVLPEPEPLRTSMINRARRNRRNSLNDLEPLPVDTTESPVDPQPEYVASAPNHLQQQQLHQQQQQPQLPRRHSYEIDPMVSIRHSILSANSNLSANNNTRSMQMNESFLNASVSTCGIGHEDLLRTSSNMNRQQQRMVSQASVSGANLSDYEPTSRFSNASRLNTESVRSEMSALSLMSFDDVLIVDPTNIAGRSVPAPSSASSAGQRERNRQFLAQESGRESKFSLDQMQTCASFTAGGNGENTGTSQRSMSLTEVLMNLDQIVKNRVTAGNATGAAVGAPLPNDVQSAALAAQNLQQLHSHPIIHEGVNEDSTLTNNHTANDNADDINVDPRNLGSMTGNFDDLSFLGGLSMSLVKGVLAGSENSSMSSKVSFTGDLEDGPVIFSSETREKNNDESEE